MDYGDRLMANFHVNWLSPVKIRQMIFAGSRKSLIFNELNTTEPIKVYDRGIEVGQSRRSGASCMVNYRSGDIWSPHIEPSEALQAAVSHFAECIREARLPSATGAWACASCGCWKRPPGASEAQGGRVVLSNGVNGQRRLDARASRPGELHPDRPDVRLGRQRESCTASLTSMAARSATTHGSAPSSRSRRTSSIGARCKIQSHTFVCEGVTIEDEVFVGHGVMFINDLARGRRPTAGRRPRPTGRSCRPASAVGPRSAAGR